MFLSKQCGLHKGVKFFDISTGRVYISRDVIFDEKKNSLLLIFTLMPAPYFARRYFFYHLTSPVMIKGDMITVMIIC